MGCGAGFMRIILIIFNTLFLLAGLAGLAGGIWMAVAPSAFFKFIETTLEGTTEFVRNSAYAFIGASCLIILIAALGCFGACARNRCALGTYSAFMIILLAIQIAAIVLVVVFDQKFKDDTINTVRKTFQSAYPGSTDSEFTKAIDKIQKDFKCCGVANSTDYILMKPTQTVPPSCGANLDKGCYEAIRGWVKTNLGLVIGVTVAVIVFQIILFIFAICLCRHSDFGKIV